MRIPNASLALPPEDSTREDAVWLYRDENRQALILSRHDAEGNFETAVLPESGLRQDASGPLRYKPVEPAPGFPLAMFEDPQLAVSPDRARSPGSVRWHSELDWLHAVHKTAYSNGIVACMSSSSGRISQMGCMETRRCLQDSRRESGAWPSLIF